jgi:hypothetical protein
MFLLNDYLPLGGLRKVASQACTVLLLSLQAANYLFFKAQHRSTDCVCRRLGPLLAPLELERGGANGSDSRLTIGHYSPDGRRGHGAHHLQSGRRLGLTLQYNPATLTNRFYLALPFASLKGCSRMLTCSALWLVSSRSCCRLFLLHSS